MIAAEKIGPTTIWLHPGTHRVAHTFSLDESHSGAEGFSIRYTARGGEAIITSSTPLPTDAFRPTTSSRVRDEYRPHIVEVALADVGIADLQPPPDFYTGRGGIPTLYAGEKAMPLSRWPNGDEDTAMGTVLDVAEERGKVGKFRYRDARHTEWDVSGGVWLSGLWRTPWDRQQVKVAQIEDGTITLAAHIGGGIGSKYHRPAKDGTYGSGEEPYCAINLPEEIDQPGEWCIDYTQGTLLWWPPTAVRESGMMGVEIASMGEPLIQSDGASHIEFRNLTFANSIGRAIDIRSGTHVRVLGCEFSHCGSGVSIYEGMHHRVQSSDFHDLSGAAIDYTRREDRHHPRGENSKNLISDGHVFENNHIYRVAQDTLRYAVAICDYRRGYATGCVFRHNLLHDLPNMAVRFCGNENLLEYNEVHNIGLRTGDVGAFYMNLKHTAAGNRLRQNLIHHCIGVNAFYLDDGASGSIVRENIVYKADVGGWISGGRENVITDNIFIDCVVAAQHVDDRGVSRGYGDPDTHWGRYIWTMEVPSVDFGNGAWAKKYPGMGERLQQHRGLPVGNVLGRNVLVDNPIGLRKKYQEKHFQHMTFPASHELDEVGFVDLATLDLRLRDDAPIKHVKGFPTIHTEKIGLYLDAYRTELPSDPNRLISLKTDSHFKSAKDLEASNQKEAKKD